MPVNSTHAEYDASLGAWCRARDVMAGEDAIKAAGEKYLPRLDSQTIGESEEGWRDPANDELRQSGESSILGYIAVNVSASLSEVLRWTYWWNSTEESPDDVTAEQVMLELNTDFSTKGMSAQEIMAVVAAWQVNAISRDTMTELV